MTQRPVPTAGDPHGDAWRVQQLAAMVAVLTRDQRLDLIALHAALLRDHGRHYRCSELVPYYEALVRLDTTQVREVGQ